jgi:hypothetical protein
MPLLCRILTTMRRFRPALLPQYRELPPWLVSIAPRASMWAQRNVPLLLQKICDVLSTFAAESLRSSTLSRAECFQSERGSQENQAEESYQGHRAASLGQGRRLSGSWSGLRRLYRNGNHLLDH